jgi:hypothetical protein
MIAEMQLLEKIIVLVRQLSPEYRLRLIQRITELSSVYPSDLTKNYRCPENLGWGNKR